MYHITEKYKNQTCGKKLDSHKMANPPSKTHLFMTKNSVTFDAKVAELRPENNRLMI